MKYQMIKVLKEEAYRSNPMVNMTDDMVRITFTCSRNKWHEIKRHITNAIHSDGGGCAATDRNSVFCDPECTGDCKPY
jgi:hypothetical protein